MKPYMQLARQQQYPIHALMKAGKNLPQIAEVIRIHPSTISRE